MSELPTTLWTPQKLQMFFANAEAGLECVTTAKEAKMAADAFQSFLEFAKAQSLPLPAQNKAAGIIIKYRIRAGWFLRRIQLERAGRPGKIGNVGVTNLARAYKEAGITKKTGCVWKRLTKYVDAEVDKGVEHATKAGLDFCMADLLKQDTDLARSKRAAEQEAKRQENARKVKKAKCAEDYYGTLSTILADPPWDWEDEGDVNQLGRAKPDYAALSIEQLTALPIAKYAAENCHLYLWITNRSLPKGFSLLEAWGFRYVTMLTWPKPSFGMGNYFRGQTEHVLFGIKGSLPLLRKDAATLLPAWARGPDGNSSKPVEFHEFIESCSPGPWGEAFGRRMRPGWVNILGENT